MRDGRWGETTGMEYAVLNAIYNVRRGLPCYQDLNQNASIPVYNYGFYSFYGLTARLVNVGDDQYMTFVRLLTLGFAVGICAAMAFWVRRTIPNWRDSGIAGIILAISASVTICFGPFIGWFSLSARPDIPMVAAELTGFALAIIGLKRRNLFLFLCSAGIFALAWSFKQNAFSLFSGVLLLTLLLRQWRFFILSSLTFTSFVTLIFILAGPSYIKHAFYIFAFNNYSLTNIIRELQTALITGFYVLIPAIYVGYIIFKSDERADSLFILPWLLSGLGAVSCLVAIGTSRNHLFTFYYIGGLVVIYGIAKILRGEISFQKRLTGLIALSIVIALGAVLTLSYLLFPNRFGRITVPVFPGASPSQRHLYLSASEPKFIENPFDALPWNSGQIPSESINTYFYFSLVKGGMFKETIEDRAQRGYYASAFVSNQKFVQAFKSNKYDLVSLLPNGVWYFKRTAEASIGN